MVTITFHCLWNRSPALPSCKELRSKNTLNPELPFTNCCKGYFALSEHRYIHSTVNHSKNFVDPETSTNTRNLSLRGIVCAHGSIVEESRRIFWQITYVNTRGSGMYETKDTFAFLIENIGFVYPGKS